jgi:TrmH family RNA methyltransferase
MDGNNIFTESNLKPGILILGNEGKGISEQVNKITEHKLSIPSFGNAESLNVAVATGILLAEFVRRINFYS